MIHAMLKSSFTNIETKPLNYREYKNCSFGNFKEDLSEAFQDYSNLYDQFISAFITALDTHILNKTKWLR